MEATITSSPRLSNENLGLTYASRVGYPDVQPVGCLSSPYIGVASDDGISDG
jgi:hypothetical protein